MAERAAGASSNPSESRAARVAGLRARFLHRFALQPGAVARAPGRVNLIGEHTDYNDGFVLPIAVERDTWVAAALHKSPLVRVFSQNLGEAAEWPPGGWNSGLFPHWTSYIAGVVELFRRRGAAVAGCALLIDSDVPPGGGLSSSAALTVGVGRALAAACGESFAGAELAELARAAENEFAAVPCGIMDPYVSLLAQRDRALFLDCRARTWEQVPLRLSDHSIVIIDSRVRHELAAGEYARRQRECRAAVTYFQKLPARDGAGQEGGGDLVRAPRDTAAGGVRALRDVDVETVRSHAARMEPRAAARARHVVSEIRRTKAAADALRNGELAEFGRLMNASHGSLRDDYEVSCAELDRLVEIVGGVRGVLGARMTGGGFGGCVVALAESGSLAEIQARVREGYDDRGFGPARIFTTAAADGASVESG